MAASPCIGCGVLLEDLEGPTHRYMLSSPACWKAYGQVLEREYSMPELGDVHRLSVDAYAAQHPGEPTPQSMKSVGVHLIRLHLNLERGFDVRESNQVMVRASGQKHRFHWLEPPASRGRVTVVEVLEADDATAHREAVRRWARSVWEAWGDHHPTVRSWAEALFD